jgi:hypothetical protein
MKPSIEKAPGQHKIWLIAVKWRTELSADNKIFQISGFL